MPKEEILYLKRDAIVETEQGKKHTFKYGRNDEDLSRKITLTIEQWGEFPNDWLVILAGNIGDEITISLSGGFRQGALE